jgi:hypothetical protein
VDLLLETLRLHGDTDGAALRSRWAALSPAGLAALVDYESCVLWLQRRVHELDLLDLLPDSFAQWLSGRAHQIAARNLLVDAQRNELVAILNEWRVPHVLLKGAALRLVSHVYPYADARRTTDVDVLLSGAAARSTWLRLQTAGFASVPDSGGAYDNHFHLPPLRNGKAVTVELHTSTSGLLPPLVAWNRFDGKGQTVTCSGGPTQVPSATELLWHAITHAPLPHPYAFRIRFLQDAAVVWAAAADIDWDEIATRLAGSELPHRALARCWLGTAARLAGLAHTDRALGTLPALDLSLALSWRLSVFRPGRGGGLHDHRAVWGPHPISRGRRLLIDAGTRAELGLPPTPSRSVASVDRLVRWVAGAAARVCYHAWRSFSRASVPLGGSRELNLRQA